MRGMLWTINSSVSIFERYSNTSKKSQEAMSPTFFCFLLILGEQTSNKINKLIRIRTQLLSSVTVPLVLTYLQCKRNDRLQRPLTQYQSEKRATNLLSIGRSKLIAILWQFLSPIVQRSVSPPGTNTGLSAFWIKKLSAAVTQRHSGKLG